MFLVVLEMFWNSLPVLNMKMKRILRGFSRYAYTKRRGESLIEMQQLGRKLGEMQDLAVLAMCAQKVLSRTRVCDTCVFTDSIYQTQDTLLNVVAKYSRKKGVIIFFQRHQREQ